MDIAYWLTTITAVGFGFWIVYLAYQLERERNKIDELETRLDIVRDQRAEIYDIANKLKYIQQLYGINKWCCWVHEYGGYWAYCHKDGRLITRTGHNKNTERTWSSVGNTVLKRNGII